MPQPVKHTPAARELPPAFGTAIEGTWFVKSEGGILSLTLEQLDQAFQRGEVCATTPVFTSGMDAWDTLGNVANLEGGAEDAPSAPPEPVSEEVTEITLESSDGGSFPPTTAGALGSDGLPWANIAAPETEGSYTLVRRSKGVVPYPIRKAAGILADFAASVRLSHPRLAAAGPWLFGAALSGIFVFSLYELGAASTRPGAHTKSGWITARATAADPTPSIEARPVTAAALPTSAPVSPRSIPSEPAAPPASSPSDDSVATLRPSDLRLAAPTRSEAQLARSARAKARASKAAAKKTKARATRKLARRTEKSRSSAFD